MTTPIAMKTAGSSGALGDPSPSLPPADKTVAGDRPTLAKAALKLYDPKEFGGKQRGSIAFQFNPKEVTIAKTAKWERKPVKHSTTAGPPEFTGADPCKLTIEMFFDASGNHDGSVVEAVEQLFSCCIPTSDSISRKKPAPPLVVLTWGKTSSFPSFVTSVSAKYTLFSPDGIPIRAVCSVALEEMPNEPWPQNPTSGAKAVHRSHSMVGGDSLASIAYAEYGDPTMWRALAAYNGIDDPLRVPAGRTLLLPDPAELV